MSSSWLELTGSRQDWFWGAPNGFGSMSGAPKQFLAAITGITKSALAEDLILLASHGAFEEGAEVNVVLRHHGMMLVNDPSGVCADWVPEHILGKEAVC